jgi:hypothetical protein
VRLIYLTFATSEQFQKVNKLQLVAIKIQLKPGWLFDTKSLTNGQKLLTFFVHLIIDGIHWSICHYHAIDYNTTMHIINVKHMITHLQL